MARCVLNPSVAKPQRLVYHPVTLPISAAFGLRYVSSLMRKWAASGTLAAKCMNMRPVEW